MLQELSITNWKAFEDKRISFGPGLNFFVGPNGSGKTTLLDAVSLALTGSIPMGDFKALVRDKEKEAAIQLELTSGQTHYMIRRRFTADRLGAAEWCADRGRWNQLTWEGLSARLAHELKTDPVFFSRVIYMSEMEVFEYAKDPPAEALNSALERVLGIVGLTAVADSLERMSRVYGKTVSSLRAELARPAAPVPVLEGELEISNLRARLNETRAELDETERRADGINADLRRLHSLSHDLEHSTNLLRTCASACTELDLAERQLPTSIEGLEALNERVMARVRELSDSVALLSEQAGRAESVTDYLASIQSLLAPLVDSDANIEPPCPVCSRPIDKALAGRLMEDTKGRISESKHALARIRLELESVARQLQSSRLPAQRLNLAVTELHKLQDNVESKGVKLDFVEIEALARETSQQVTELGDEARRTRIKAEELREKITAAATMIGRLEGRGEATELRRNLQTDLVQRYKGWILTETLVSALRELVNIQRDEGVKPLYLTLEELWRRWRPEEDCEIVFDVHGRIELRSGKTNLKFSQLSGGERTVLLILSRVIMLSLLSKMDFLMIDEPLEHLDLRNRRAVLNFLAAATRCKLTNQAIVTTFEESLVRKYLEGPDTRTVYLKEARRK
jgi:DNA repair exonuclease SbcCD ATPase subunit